MSGVAVRRIAAVVSVALFFVGLLCIGQQDRARGAGCIVGGGFICAPAGAVVAATTWNNSDKSADIGLSNGFLTLTVINSGRGAVRTVASLATNQKLYFETTVNNLVDALGVGIANATLGLDTVTGGFLTSPSNSGGVRQDGLFLCADSPDNITNAIPAFTTGDTVDVAFNAATGKMWFRKNNGAWNASVGGGQDPAAGTGGLTLSVTGPYFVVGWGEDLLNQLSARFSSSSWLDTAPAGFTQLQ